MLIVEGSDCVGKTTFCHKLIKALEDHGPWIYQHLDPPPPLWHFPKSYFPIMSQHIIQDRFHMSEIVYSEAREMEPRLSWNDYRTIDAIHRCLGGVTVVLTANAQVIEHNYSSNELYSLETALKVDRLFRHHIDNPQVDCDFHWNSHGFYPDQEFLERVLMLYLERQEICYATTVGKTI